MLVFYFVFLNLFTFFLFAEDKKRARKEMWRIPERTLLLLLCGSCLLQLLAIMKSKRVLYYISNVSVLFLYGVITLLFTTIVDRFYIKLPFAFAIPAGIGMIMWYCRDILQKKGKHGTGNKKT